MRSDALDQALDNVLAGDDAMAGSSCRGANPLRVVAQRFAPRFVEENIALVKTARMLAES